MVKMPWVYCNALFGRDLAYLYSSSAKFCNGRLELGPIQLFLCSIEYFEKLIMKTISKILQWFFSISMLMAAFGGFFSGDVLMATIISIIGLVLFPPLSKVLFGKKSRKSSPYKNRDISAENLKKPYDEESGFLEGYHYTEYVEPVKQLKRENRYSEAVELLLKIVDKVEQEAKEESRKLGLRRSPPPWYYEQLAIIYRKEKRYDDEVAILDRYMQQEGASGTGDSKMEKRLRKAKELAGSDKKNMPTTSNIQYEPEQIQRQGFQILESLHILSTTKNIDTLKGRFEFILQLYDHFIQASHNKRFISDVQVSIDQYKTTYYERIPDEYELNLLLKPDKEHLKQFYAKCVMHCLTKFQEEQEKQIESLKRRDAKERRINKIIQVADEAQKELLQHESQNGSNNEYVEEISRIREAYKERLES